MRFLALLLVSAAVHGALLVLAVFFNYRPAQPMLRAGEITVEFSTNVPSAPSPRIDASPREATNAAQPNETLDKVEPTPPQPPPLVMLQQPDRPLVLPAPLPPSATAWQSDFTTWSNERTVVSQRVAEADLRQPLEHSPRERNAPPATSRPMASIPLRELVSKTNHTSTKPPSNAQAKPSPTKPQTVAKAEGTPSPGSAPSARSENQARGVRTDARMLGSAYPPYPLEARRLGVEGRVVLAFRVTERGEVVKPRVMESSGHAILDEAALEFIRDVRYQPARLGTQVLSTEEYLAIRYRLY